jgi:small subunit ribosomal protein S6
MFIYESTFIIDGKVPETEIDKHVEKFSAVIKGSGGEILQVQKLGKRELAYKIEGSREGYYVYFELKLEAGAVKELERNYKITDSVIRFLTVLKEERKPSKRKKKKPVAPTASTVSSAPSASSTAPAAPAAPSTAEAPKDAPKSGTIN